MKTNKTIIQAQSLSSHHNAYVNNVLCLYLYYQASNKIYGYSRIFTWQRQAETVKSTLKWGSTPHIIFFSMILLQTCEKRLHAGEREKKERVHCIAREAEVGCYITLTVYLLTKRSVPSNMWSLCL